MGKPGEEMVVSDTSNPGSDYGGQEQVRDWTDEEERKVVRKCVAWDMAMVAFDADMSDQT